jgi:hypothetical protein
MSIGLAIVIVAIVGFAIYSRGFRRAVLIAVGVVGVAIAIINNEAPECEGYHEPDVSAFCRVVRYVSRHISSSKE